MKPHLTVEQHYDKLAESGHWEHNTPDLQRYMERWDGSPFYTLIGDTTGKNILEVGIGSGRIAGHILKQGCQTLTGLDISLETIAVARANLASFNNLELIHSDITAFRRRDSFNIAYSVLTFMHIEDKTAALRVMANALHVGGHIVLSIDHASNWLDFGEWRVRLFPWAPERYIDTLREFGFTINDVVPIIDQWVGGRGEKLDTYGTAFATLIKASKPSSSYKERRKG